MLVPLALAAKIEPIEFQNQRALPIKCLTFLPVGRPHPVSDSMSVVTSSYQTFFLRGLNNILSIWIKGRLNQISASTS